MTTYLDRVAAAGYPTLTDPDHPIDPAAARMLPDDPAAVGLAMAGDVLLVALDRVPTPARFAELEEATGMGISVTITTPELLATLRNRASQPAPGHHSQLLTAILADAARTGATDILLATGQRPAVRVAGDFQTLTKYPPMPAKDLTSASEWFLGTQRTQGAVTVGKARWRIRTGTTAGTSTIAMRQLPAAPPRAEEALIPVGALRAAETPHGLIIVAGPHGSGTTTTAAALVDHINTTRAAHIVVTGNPVEYRHRSRRAVITEQHVGRDVPDTATAVTAARNLGADVIVAEVDNADDAHAVLAAAVAGHLVIAPTPGPSISDALTGLIAMFHPSERDWASRMLAATLRAATAQVMVPSTSSGRTAVFEVLVPTAAAQSAIRAGQLELLPAMVEEASAEGTMSLTRSLAAQVAAGRLHPAAARQVCPHPELLEEYLAGVARTTHQLPEETEPAPPRAPLRRAEAQPPAPAPAPSTPASAATPPAPTRATLRRGQQP